MKRLLFALFLLSGNAFADETPTPSVHDTRIQYVEYNAGDVVTVEAKAGRAVRLVFAPSEKILDVASGFTDGWELVERGNILFLKAKSLKGEGGAALSPQPEKWNTNLVVTTSLRLYDFDLRLVDGAGAYRVEFRYPEDEKEEAALKESEELSQSQLNERLPPRNWNYTMVVRRRSDGIAPTMAYDDGNFTYLRFPNNREFPAVFVISADGSESLVNTHVEGDVLVVHQVSKKMMLCYGRAVVSVFNEAFDADGVAPKSGTTAPGVTRKLKEKP